jgi:hypothetical protein
MPHRNALVEIGQVEELVLFHRPIMSRLRRRTNQADNEWLRYRLAESDWQWNVGIGVALEFDGNELVPWDLG